MKRIWLLGPSSAGVDAVETLLRQVGQTVFDVSKNELSLDPEYESIRQHGGTIYCVECDPDSRLGIADKSLKDCAATVVHLDSNCPSNPGYNRPPEEFLPASTLGQVISRLALIGLIPPEWPSHRPEPQEPSKPVGTIYFESNDSGKPQWYISHVAAGNSTASAIPPDLVLAAGIDEYLKAASQSGYPDIYYDVLQRFAGDHDMTDPTGTDNSVYPCWNCNTPTQGKALCQECEKFLSGPYDLDDPDDLELTEKELDSFLRERENPN